MSIVCRPLPHPGEIVRLDILPALGLDFAQAAAKMTIDQDRFKDFLDGKADLDAAEAREIESQFQMPATMVINGQKNRAAHKAQYPEFYKVDDIPDALKAKYVPLMKDTFNQLSQLLNAASQSPDPENDLALIAARDAYHQKVGQVSMDFANDGGTGEQWNILAPAVHQGHYGP